MIANTQTIRYECDRCHRGNVDNFDLDVHGPVLPTLPDGWMQMIWTLCDTCWDEFNTGIMGEELMRWMKSEPA